MEHCNQCIQQNNLSYQKIESPLFIARSKGLIGEYNKTKGMCEAKVMCYSIPLIGDEVNPNYCTN